MATILLLAIYIAYIGLGIPDPLFGTAWPAIYAELQLPIAFAGIVGALVSSGTVISSLFSARLVKRMGTNTVVVLSTALTAAALLGYAYAGHPAVLCLLAVPLGLGAGAVDAALNNYVALHYSAAHISFLHCFYGVGVTVSPFILSRVIGGIGGWRGGYRVAFLIQLAITALLLLSLPVWKRVRGQEVRVREKKLKVLSLRQLAALPGVKVLWCLLFTSCAIEWICGSWSSTFLVEHRHAAASTAAGIVTFYYGGMALGRFLSGILAERWGSVRRLWIGQCVLGAGLLALLLPGPVYIAAAGLFLAGLGDGPLFPNFSYLIPRLFGEEVSHSVMGAQMAAANLGILLMPPLCGLLGQWVGMGVFPLFLLVLYGVMMAAMGSARDFLAERKG